jgi:spermidine synthase
MPRKNNAHKGLCYVSKDRLPLDSNLVSDPTAIAVAIFLAGFASSIGQILVLRELLVLFYGNELSTGLVFACWFLWTAAGSGFSGRAGAKRGVSAALLLAGLLLLAVLLPAAVLWVRAARAVWSVPPGELLSPWLMIATTFSATGGLCFFSGALFGLAWRARAAGAGAGNGESRAIPVYLFEAAGAAAGGLVFYFILLPFVSGFGGSLVVASILAGSVFLLACRERLRLRGALPLAAAALLIAAATGGALALRGEIEHFSRRLQWGSGFVESRDTPFHNLALLERSGQYSLFSNGLWLFSVPDPQSAEFTAHLPLLQHEKPESVLLVGGCASGIVAEVLKHPDVRLVDCVEPDPEIIRLARESLPVSAVRPLDDPRVRFHYRDANTFMSSGGERWDVIVMSLGEPANAEMNRFYTREFFARARERLKDGGVYSFSTASSPEMVGPRNALLLQSLNRTLSGVFEDVLPVSAEGVRFFASNRKNVLTTDAAVLIRRLAERKLDLQYVRDYALSDLMGSMRLAYAAAIASPTEKTKENLDFEPVCYLQTLVLWGAQIHPALGDWLLALSGIGRGFFWLGLGAVLGAVLLAFRFCRGGIGSAVLLNVAVAGGVQMGLEIVLLLGFQILEGFVYRELALIITFYMAGLSLGAGVVSGLASRIVRPGAWLFRAQMLMALYLPGVLGVLYLLKDAGPGGQGAFPLPAVFMALALIGGLIGGIHFSLGVLAYGKERAGRQGRGGSMLYAADLAGAAAGGLAASLFILPAYGIPAGLLAGAALAAGASLLLVFGGSERR